MTTDGPRLLGIDVDTAWYRLVVGASVVAKVQVQACVQPMIAAAV